MAELYLGDNLPALKSFKEQHKHIDLILTSPPYNMNLRIHNGKYRSRQVVRELTTKYEGFADNLPIDEYYTFLSDRLAVMLDIAPLVFLNIQPLTGNKRAVFKLIGDFSDQLKEVIIWDKQRAEPAIGEGVLNSQFEFILVFSKHNSISRKFEGYFKRGTLSNVIKVPKNVRGRIHKAEFPTLLVETILTNFTKEGDTVLDPFMGSGTVGQVCKQLNRNFIGVELLPKYYEYAKEALND